MCSWMVGVRCRELVHISQTVLAFDGTPQLKLFDSGSDPPAEKIVEREQAGDFIAACAMDASVFTTEPGMVRVSPKSGIGRLLPGLQRGIARANVPARVLCVF